LEYKREKEDKVLKEVNETEEQEKKMKIRFFGSGG